MKVDVTVFRVWPLFLFLFAIISHAGDSPQRKFNWKLSNVSVPSLSRGGAASWAPTLNDPAMAGRARLTLFSNVEAFREETITWTIQGPYDFASESFPSPAVQREGGAVATVITQGMYQVSMRIGSVISPNRVVDSDMIVSKNVVIVSMGDSYASGEGNPESERNNHRAAIWANDPLEPSKFSHRTRRAASFQAAFELDNVFENQAVELIFVAQTGAEITEGILGTRWDCIHFAGRDICWELQFPTQIGLLRQALGARRADHLLITIGGNDIGFSSIIQGLIKNTNVPIFGDGADSLPSLRGFHNLPSRYESLNKALHENFQIGKIYITEYPNPLSDSDGKYPAEQANDVAGVGGFDISRNDAKWAERHVLKPLNQAVRQAADRWGWTYIGGIEEAFHGHGYPADLWVDGEIGAFPGTMTFLKQLPPIFNVGPKTISPTHARWVRTALESRIIQEDALKSKGTYHPNSLGHEAIGKIISKTLRNSIERERLLVPKHGGPYLINPGTKVNLSASFPPYQNQFKGDTVFLWDIGATGNYLSAQGASATYTPPGDAGTIPVSLLAINTNTLDFRRASTYIQVKAAPPAVRVIYTNSVERGLPFRLNLEIPTLAGGVQREIVATRVEWGDEPGPEHSESSLLDPVHVYVSEVATQQFKVFVSERAVEFRAGAGWQELIREWGIHTGKVAVLAPVTYRGTISGQVSYDFDANGKIDGGPCEVPSAGAVVYVDSNNNGVREPSEPHATTDSNGRYRIISLPDGKHILRGGASIPPISCRGSGPVTFTLPSSGFRRIEITNGLQVERADFYWTATWGLAGNVIDGSRIGDAPIATNGSPAVARLFDDVNGNFARDPNERTLEIPILPQGQTSFSFWNGATVATVDSQGSDLEVVSPEAMPAGTMELMDYCHARNSFYAAPDNNHWFPSFSEDSPLQTIIFPSEGTYYKIFDTGTGTAGSLPATAEDLELLGDFSQLGNPVELPIEGRAIYHRQFYAQAGSVIAFDWNFVTEEPSSRRDVAFASLLRAGSCVATDPPSSFCFEKVRTEELVNSGEDLPTLPGLTLRSSGWRSGFLEIRESGWYRVAFGVLDKADAEGRSGLAVDNVELIGTPARLSSGFSCPPDDPACAQDCLQNLRFTVRRGASQVAGGAWLDENANGIQEPGEPVQENMSVELYQAGPDNAVGGGDDALVAMTRTDSDGNYEFTSVPRGIYFVRFRPNSGFGFTVEGVGPEESNNDADPDRGCTRPFAVRSSPYVDMARLNASGQVEFKPTSQRRIFRAGNISAGLVPGRTRIIAAVVDVPETSEDGGRAQFHVALNRAPASDVAVELSVSISSEASLSTSQILFTPSNWNVPQLVTVTGNEDLRCDGDVTYQVILGLTTSADLEFAGLPPVYLEFINRDNEAPLLDDRLAPNHAIARAAVMGSGDWLAQGLVLRHETPEDWFTLFASQSGQLEATFTFVPENSGTPQLELLNEAGERIASADLSAGTNLVRLTYGPVADGQVFYLRAALVNEISIPKYDLNVAFRAMPDFTSDVIMGLAPLVVTFTNLSVSAIAGQLWNFGDGSMSTSVAPTHTYARAGAYPVSLVVSNATLQSVSSRELFVLVTNPPPKISVQPEGKMVAPGQTALFSVTADAIEPVSFQWFRNEFPLAVGGKIAGATNATLMIANVTAQELGNYSVRVSNSDGTVFSVEAVLAFAASVAPAAAFTASPLRGTAPLTVTFSDYSAGAITNRKWNFGDGTTVNLAGNSIANVYSEPGAYSALLTVSGPGGTNSFAQPGLIVIDPSQPSILQQPRSRVIQRGESATFAVMATGTPPLSYQWTKDGTNLNATQATFELAAAQISEAGAYAVTISGPGGFVVSSNATLSLISARAGDLDLSFARNARITGSYRSLIIPASGGALLGGEGSTSTNLLRLDSSGNVDAAFHLNQTSILSQRVLALCERSDQKIFIGGTFQLRSSPTRHLARIDPDGRRDTTFLNGLSGLGNSSLAGAFCVSAQTGGWLLVGGYFQTVNGTTRRNLARMRESDGLLDSSFVPAIALTTSTLYCICPQPDGKILIGGDFASVGGIPRRNLARLNQNGTLDVDFLQGVDGPDAPVHAMVLQPDGRILIGGSFRMVNGESRTCLARLEADGRMDRTFQGEANDWVQSIVLQPDQKILVGGAFTVVSSAARHRLARLMPDGSADQRFQNGMTGADGAVHAIALQPDKNIIIAGDFTTVNGHLRARVARLFGEDHSFAPLIIKPPLAQAVNLGAHAVFSVEAVGTAPLAYQWSRAGIAIPTATNSVLLLSALGVGDAAAYSVTVRNDSGSVTSPPASLTLTYPPSISKHPVGLIANEGQTVHFSVEAAGTSPLSYQWRVDGFEVPLATSSILTLANLEPSNTGGYSVVVTNPFGRATSKMAFLVALPETFPLNFEDPGVNQGQFQFQISGPEGVPIVVDISTDLKSWSPISTNLITPGGFRFTDPSPLAEQMRFYRFRLTVP